MDIHYYEGNAMKSYREFSSIYLCVRPVDFRKEIYGLVNLIKIIPIAASIPLITAEGK
jgi:hypothetical protein